MESIRILSVEASETCLAVQTVLPTSLKRLRAVDTSKADWVSVAGFVMREN
jgi:hypothetical protein